jgi:4-hydroxybutyrate CoA-transferase
MWLRKWLDTSATTRCSSAATCAMPINDGRADYTPIYLSEIEELFESGAMPLDVALLQLSPPDSHGFCSFGVGVDTTLTAAKCARPRGGADQRPDAAHLWRQFHSCQRSSTPSWSRIAAAVRDEEAESHRLHVAIARNVAGLIEDGAVLQTGIGGIPDAVLPFLMDRKDLGVHSELVSDGVIPLIEAGVITGARKNFKPRKIIGFRAGQQEGCSISWTTIRSSNSTHGLYQRSRR